MLTFQQETTLDAVELAEVFRSSGILRPYEDLSRLQRMIEHANLIVTARDADRLIGVARCLTDFSWCCYVSDLAVMKERQHQGIGRQLLARVNELVGDECTVILNAGPGAESYYQRVGFVPVTTAWKIQRKK